MEMGSPKFKEDGSRTKFIISDLPSTYAIDGQVLSAPKLISAPEVTAMLDVYASGYIIQVIINGAEQANVINTSYSGLVEGGIKKNNNKIVISISQTEKDNPFKPSIIVRCMLADRITKECFKFEPKKNIEGKHEFSFNAEK
jgi:ribosomal protein L21E